MGGIFIVFEGIDGSGKSTQIRKLYNYLKSHSKSVILTREPGGTEAGEKLRNLLLNHPFSQIEQFFILTANRADHIKNIISPALKENKIVLCDRFYDSTKVYQSDINESNHPKIAQLGKNIAFACPPDFTFLFDIEPELAMQRISLRSLEKNKDVFEAKQTLETLNKRRQIYLDIAKNNPEKYCIINASQCPEDIFSQILKKTLQLILNKQRDS